MPSIGFLNTDATLVATCVLTTDGSLLTDIQQEVDFITGTVAIANVGSVPVTVPSRSHVFLPLHDGETIMIGGLIKTVRTPIFSPVPLLDRAPVVGKSLNRLLTYPFRRTQYELVVLLKATVLPPPKPPLSRLVNVTGNTRPIAPNLPPPP
jgi:type II secretory pathway component GspD/PulD (secretin)